MGEAKLLVELVAWTQGAAKHDGFKFVYTEPTEVVGRAAGICWNKEEKEDYDEFVKRVIKIGHESVIEHASFTFRIEGISRALSHQFVRHRLCSFSQRSQRYVKEKEPNYVKPDFSEFKNRTMQVITGFEPDIAREFKSNGSHDNPHIEINWSRTNDCDRANAIFEDAMKKAWESYNLLLSIGIKGEDARFVLPNACETKIWWTANARELRHFFKLRLDKHAQWEIRAMAVAMFDEVYKVAPALFEDLKELREKAVK